MPDRHPTFRQFVQIAAGKDLADKPHRLVAFDLAVVCRHRDARAFLTAVLQGKQTVIRKAGRLVGRRQTETKNSAFLS